MKCCLIQLTNVSTSEVIRTKQVEIGSSNQLTALCREWLNSFLRGCTIPIDAGEWQLTITYADVELNNNKVKQLNLF